MSVNTWYLCITPERLDQLIQETEHDPEAPAKYIHPEEDEDVDYEHPEPGLWTERNWLGLHSLLTFGPWAEQPLLGQSIAGGTPIGGDDFFMGPVRYFTHKEVSDIAVVLNCVDEKALEQTCDAEVLNDAKVPPVGGWRDGDFVYLWKTFTDIRDFFQMAQERSYAVLVYLS